MAKAQNDLVFRDASGFEVGRDALFGIVFLNPDFTVDDFQVGDDAVVMMYAFPAPRHQRELVPLAINQQARLHSSGGAGMFGISGQHALGDVG